MRLWVIERSHERGDDPVSRANGESNPGGRGSSKKRSTGDSRPVAIPPSVAQEKSDEALTVAVTGFLADLRLTGSERVLGALFRAR
jgi:hypothetical protein